MTENVFMCLWFLLCLESNKTVTVIYVCKPSPLPSVCKVPFHCSQVLDCITVQQEVVFSPPPVKISISVYWGKNHQLVRHTSCYFV